MMSNKDQKIVSNLEGESVGSREFRLDVKRMINTMQYYRYSLDTVRVSDTIKKIAAQAKENKKKGWIDLRITAANGIRACDKVLLDMKAANMSPDTWRIIVDHMISDVIHEHMLIIDEISDIYEIDTLEEIRNMIREFKRQLQEITIKQQDEHSNNNNTDNLPDHHSHSSNSPV